METQGGIATFYFRRFLPKLKLPKNILYVEYYVLLEMS